MPKPLLIRLPLMALVLLGLLAGLWTGLNRMGALPPLRPLPPAAHGPLMVSGFLGTLISLERAVALQQRWPYVGPLLSGLGALALLAGLPTPVGALLMTLAGGVLTAVSLIIVRRQTALYTITMGLGAAVWLGGSALWLAGWPLYRVVSWWAGFLVLTIVGERLELSRVLRLGRGSQLAFAAATSLFLGGLALSLFAFAAGVRLASVGLIGLALWLAHYDVARRTVRQQGLTRYIAANLLFGYGWLAVSGILGLWFGGVMAGLRYDAWLHALFLGFVFGMIFAHAPIILPALTGLSVPYHPVFYGPVALLQLSLLLRVVGDLLPQLTWRQWGGWLNTAAILWFLAQIAMVTALQARRGHRIQSAGIVINTDGKEHG
jgi:hypothetical protein